MLNSTLFMKLPVKITTSVEYQKRNYDLKVIKKPPAVGQLVWLYEPLKKKGVCKKLTCP